eukprot:GHRQ01022612.1.p1 GENE.GHRQ01022612.1~~GHRQ01022612.1.p1  ORF type:complete len:107 (-),score=29.14 GHRQ01022612.1:1266-1586(-)
MLSYYQFVFLRVPCPCCLQDPLQLGAYLRYNIFLPDINNERDVKNSKYADNLAALQRLVLFRFDHDTTGGLKVWQRMRFVIQGLADSCSPQRALSDTCCRLQGFRV